MLEWHDSNAVVVHVDIDAEEDGELAVHVEASANSPNLGQLDYHWKKASESQVLCTSD